ncbi:hypothetical protein CDLVIII_0244 [Clostridium sp. DL-VIII]|uniref:DUF1189 family protein n=1 Tax=Clostridium sp. DL-VIII TaxID=641107 RepID=UPI00023AF0D9|nr:DUF1189 family protein [Clostridium sp. DL-VIII]EHI96982.1 hypothetical protein CDLVIII_0244 [Clostridium sp. DL-VIII]
MNNKTNFFIKVITSIYDIKVFSRYAKEGILRSIFYVILLTLILSGIKSIYIWPKNIKFELNSIIYLIVSNFESILINLLINCLLVVVIASIFTIFMKMVVKYIALYSVTLYAATLPLIIQTALETINPGINFDSMFIAGTLTYVLLILKYIKDEIINNIDSKSGHN